MELERFERYVTDAVASLPPDLLDLRGVAHTLCMSPKTVSRLLAAGRLPTADVNLSPTGGAKGRRWHRRTLLDWIDGGRMGGNQHA